MTTTHASKKKSAAPTETTPATAATAAAEQPSPPVAAQPAAAALPASPAPIIFVVQAPPPITFPAIPAGFTPVDITYYVGVLPKGAQLTVMDGAVRELRDFTDYPAVFGVTGLPQASVLQAFDIANQWSSLRAKLDLFDVFCQSQEALSWKEVHDYMGTMQTAFDLAVNAKAQIGKEHPSLSRLFGAQKEIAQKGQATKSANKKAEAEGKPPVKGKVGKRRKRVAAQALFDAANKVAAAPPAPAAAVVSPAAGATPSSNGTNNGAPHA